MEADARTAFWRHLRNSPYILMLPVLSQSLVGFTRGQQAIETLKAKTSHELIATRG